MAVTDAIFDAEEYRAAKGLLDDSDDELIDLQAIAVTRYLERASGQFFGKDATAVTRRFVGSGGTLLRLDNEGCPGIASASGVTVTADGQEYTAFELFPLNANLGAEARPFTSLVLTTSYFPLGKVIEIDAVWGWPDIPATAKEVAIELLAIWRGQSARATATMSELDGAVQMSPLAMSLVKRFVGAYTKARVG